MVHSFLYPFDFGHNSFRPWSDGFNRPLANAVYLYHQYSNARHVQEVQCPKVSSLIVPLPDSDRPVGIGAHTMTKKNSIASVASRIGLAFGMTESDPKRHALLSVGIEGIDDGSTSGSTPSTDLERPVSKGLSDAIDLSTSRQTRTDTPEFVLSPQVAPSDVHRGAAFHTWNDLPKSGHAT